MHRIAKKTNRPWKVAAWVGGALAAVVLAVFVGGKAWMSRYLRSAEFRQKIEEESGRALRAKVDLEQPRLEDSQFYTGRFEAQGTQEAEFAKITAENIRGEYQLPPFLRLLLGERKAVLDHVEIQRIDVDVTRASRLELSLPPPSTEPRKVDVKTGFVRELRIRWEGGGVNGVAVRVNEAEGGWKLDSEGGQLRIPLAIPPFDLATARGVFKDADKLLIVQEAKAQIAGGTVKGVGEFNPKSMLDLQLEVAGVDASQILPPDWRARLHGQIEGEGRLKLPAGRGGSERLLFSGKLSLKQGMLEALPVLHKIAEYTRTDRFRHLPIDQLTGDFVYDRAAQSLKVTNLVLESRQLLRVTGTFTVVNDQLDGTLTIGISPSSLRWIPGAQEKVFNVQRDGYAWAPMRLTGTTSAPKEDLSSRLAMAAGQIVVETVQDTATEAAGSAIRSGKKAANQVFDLLFGN
jgi:ATP-dependent protease HslVU (ClpYQ) peptidase subunit